MSHDEGLRELEEQAFQLIGNRRQARARLGQIFIELKRKVRQQGEDWQVYYQKRFGDSGVSLRTAQRYMDLAREAYEEEKNVSLTFLEPGKDMHAQAITNATERAKQVLSDVRPAEPMYRLALQQLNASERTATMRLWASEYRAEAEREVIGVLRRVLQRTGFLIYRFPRSETIEVTAERRPS